MSEMQICFEKHQPFENLRS